MVIRLTEKEAQKLYKERSAQVKKGKRMSRRTIGSNRLLAGIAFCGYCGEPFLSKSYSNPKKNYKREGYTCRSRKRKSPCDGTRGFWEKGELESIVIKIISKIIDEMITLDLNELMTKVSTLYNEEKNTSYKQIEKAAESLRKLKMQQDYYLKQLNKHLAGESTELPAGIIKEQVGKIDNEIKTQSNSVKELKSELDKEVINPKLLKEVILHMGNWEATFENTDMVTQRNMIEQLVESVQVYDEEIKINFKFRIQEILDCAFNDIEGYQEQDKDTNNNILQEVSEVQNFSFSQHVKNLNYRNNYNQIVREWEEKKQKPFGEIVAELRRIHSPDEVVEKLGVSRSFLYYRYGLYMNRIAYLEHIHNKPLGEIINQMREDMTMNEISDELGLAITTLYNHTRKIS